MCGPCLCHNFGASLLYFVVHVGCRRSLSHLLMSLLCNLSSVLYAIAMEQIINIFKIAHDKMFVMQKSVSTTPLFGEATL